MCFSSVARGVLKAMWVDGLATHIKNSTTHDMKKITSNIASLLAVGVLGFAALAPSANADLITGNVEIQGIATLNSVSLASATGVNGATGSVNALSTGDYEAAGLAGGVTATFSAFSFAPANTPITPLWTFNFGGATYSFDLASLTVVTHTANLLDVLGTGTLNITGGGFDPTPGTWSFQVTSTSGTNANARFSFQSSNNAVPDGGMTVAFLGLALVGVEGLRRKLVLC